MSIVTIGNSAFKISKLAKFESDTSDAGEDKASQSPEILQVFLK